MDLNNDIVEFKNGDLVHMLADRNYIGVITGITYRPSGVQYLVTWQDCEERTHYAVELRLHRRTVKKIK